MMHLESRLEELMEALNIYIKDTITKDNICEKEREHLELCIAKYEDLKNILKGNGNS